ncbi:MAG: hypothetical protein II565_02330 [Fibrobacter sp.]|nr:hypothetical protein [Fibrobacter sp.]
MNYEVKYIEEQGKIEDMVFIFDGNFSILSEFLDDVESFSKEYLEIFDRLLSGKVEKYSANGNCCSFEADKDKTIVEFLYPENENERKICTVNTHELRLLMDEWLKKKAEFFKSKKK